MGLLDRLFGRRTNTLLAQAGDGAEHIPDSPYSTALSEIGVKPGDTVHMVCPTCAASFVLELPATNAARTLSVFDGKASVTCANHCFADSTLVDFNPRPLKVTPVGWFENRHCTRYWTDAPASRCPVCGIENYRETLNRVVDEIDRLPASADQPSLVNLTKDLVATFDGVMRAMVHGHAVNLRDAQSQVTEVEIAGRPVLTTSADLAETISRWPGTVSFQNLGGARKNLIEGTCTCAPQHRGPQVSSCSTGTDIETWVTSTLGADAWRDAGRVFQKRHLYQHGLGAADAKYIAATGDHEFRVGQLVAVRRDELQVSAHACAVVAKRFFGLFLS
jgi:hypothetical protein